MLPIEHTKNSSKTTTINHIPHFQSVRTQRAASSTCSYRVCFGASSPRRIVIREPKFVFIYSISSHASFHSCKKCKAHSLNLTRNIKKQCVLLHAALAAASSLSVFFARANVLRARVKYQPTQFTRRRIHYQQAVHDLTTKLRTRATSQCDWTLGTLSSEVHNKAHAFGSR